MDRRSTSAEYTHFGGDVTAQVNSSHGIRLSGGSTGGIVESVGDDTNVSLRLRGQGTGGVLLGTAGQTVTVVGTLSQGGVFASTGITSTHINLDSTRIAIGSGGSLTATSTQVNITSTKVFIGASGSTSFLMGIRKVFVEFSVPTMAANAGAEVGDIAVTGLTTNSVIVLAPRAALNSSVAGLTAHAYCSSAGQLHVTLQNAGTTITGSTQSAYAMIHDFGIPV